MDSTGQLKSSGGDKVGFRGTVRYASLAAHELKGLRRRDDLISMYYSFLELLTGHLPWRKTNDKEAVAKLKREYSSEMLAHAFASEITKFVHHILKLTFVDKSNYELLREYVKRI